MNNPTVITALAVIFGIFSAVSFFWIRSIQKKLAQKTNEHTSLSLKWDRLVLESNTLGADLQKLSKILDYKNARTLLHNWLSAVDAQGENGTISFETEHSMSYLQPILKKMYKFFFERDFNSFSGNDSIHALTAMKICWLNLQNFIREHPEFKEKSMSILNAAISDVRNYDELSTVVQQYKSWEPFLLWEEEITPIVQAKALKLSKAEIIHLQAIITQNTGSMGSDGSKFQEVADALCAVLSVFTRELLAENDSNELKTNYKYSCVDTSLKYLRIHALELSQAKTFTQLVEKYELVYKTNTETEIEIEMKTETFQERDVSVSA